MPEAAADQLSLPPLAAGRQKRQQAEHAAAAALLRTIIGIEAKYGVTRLDAIRLHLTIRQPADWLPATKGQRLRLARTVAKRLERASARAVVSPQKRHDGGF